VIVVASGSCLNTLTWYIFRMKILNGIGVSPGIVIGKAFLLDRKKVVVNKRIIQPEEVDEEKAKLLRAICDSATQLAKLKEKVKQEANDEKHTLIIDAHLLILEDEDLRKKAEDLISQDLVNAEYAISCAIRSYTRIFDKIEDQYLRERKNDIEHVGEVIIQNITGKKPKSISSLKGDLILVAHDLSPADTAHLYKEKFLAFLTEIGGRTSHTAITARSLELPAVVGVEKASKYIESGDALIVDGMKGTVVIDPTPEVFTKYLDKQRKYKYFERELLKNKDLTAETEDGYQLSLAANIEFPNELENVFCHGANKVGLYRTEFLYLNQPSPPTKEEHLAAYKALAQKDGLVSATIRTIDIGGDKIDPNLYSEEEVNPALGLRAIRLSLSRPELMEMQLAAILQASHFGSLKILFPMISCIDELKRALKVLERVKAKLRDVGIPFDENIKVGVMIEVPSAAITADILAKDVDFFSIGTNDLIQYCIAIDRGNEKVAYLYDPLHPAVLRIIQSVIKTAHREGIWVSMCGEMAGDPLCTLILIGMEIDELSMNSVAIPSIKKIIRSVRREEAAEVAYKVMTFSTSKEIKEYVTKKMIERFPELFT